MNIATQSGSAALAGRLTAFGGVVGTLCVSGCAPVTAVLLVLVAAIVLSKV